MRMETSMLGVGIMTFRMGLELGVRVRAEDLVMKVVGRGECGKGLGSIMVRMERASMRGDTKGIGRMEMGVIVRLTGSGMQEFGSKMSRSSQAGRSGWRDGEMQGECWRVLYFLALDVLGILILFRVYLFRCFVDLGGRILDGRACR